MNLEIIARRTGIVCLHIKITRPILVNSFRKKKIKGKIDCNLEFDEFGIDLDQRNYEVSFRKIKEKGFITDYTIDEGIDELISAYQKIILRDYLLVQ